jgi:hypothetical protein
MDKVKILRISKYLLNLIVLAFICFFVSVGFSFYSISIEWSKMEMVLSIISKFLPFVILILTVITVINYCIEKYLEKRNRKEYLKLLMIHLIVTFGVIVFYAYEFYATVEF